MPNLVYNKKATWNFELLEKLEAGVQLHGYEVKSLRGKQGSLDGAYIIIRGGEAFLIGAHIPPFQASNTPKGYDPYRNRKLLLSKKQLAKLSGQEATKGLTIVPISLYTKGRNIKLEVAVGKGKKKHDKRESLKKKDAKRDIDRIMKGDR